MQNEIDIETLVALTSQDLIQLGCKLGERKRLLLAIRQLNSEKFAGSAAPGAERRPSHGNISENSFFPML